MGWDKCLSFTSSLFESFENKSTQADVFVKEKSQVPKYHFFFYTDNVYQYTNVQIKIEKQIESTYKTLQNLYA